MTPKEKADDLIYKFLRAEDEEYSARIFVDEMLNYIEEIDPQGLCYELIGERDFWREVKSEL